ncbi:MAG: sugar ABC transporter permease [Nocardioidaceae bacterium]
MTATHSAAGARPRSPDQPVRPPHQPVPPLRRLVPPAMLLPTIAVLVVLVGYPLVRLVWVSFHEYGRAQIFGRPAEWIGLDNYRDILTDPQFWRVFWRSLAFCVVNVLATMTFGILVAVLMTKLHRFFRFLASLGLLVAWAMPALTAIIIWGWMFDTQFGVVNYLLTALTPTDYTGHSWLIDPMSFYAVATIVILWQSTPFVAFSVYAALTQVPEDLLEAAQLDGAGMLKRGRHVVLPILRPVLLILVMLSIIWDLRVFTQIYALQGIGGIREKTSTLGVYIYTTSVGSGDFGRGGAMAVILVLLMMVIGVAYVRSTLRQDES